MTKVLYFCFGEQLFRRVAAALPGMEQTEPKKGESILCLLSYVSNVCYLMSLMLVLQLIKVGDST